MINLDAFAVGGLVVGGDEALVQQALDIARSIGIPLMGGQEAPTRLAISLHSGQRTSPPFIS